jgi:Tol biopolymer transport system component
MRTAEFSFRVECDTAARVSKEDCGIYAIPAIGGAERKLTACYPGEEPQLAWSPDGGWLAFSDKPDAESPASIFLLSLETLERRQLTAPPRQSVGDGYVAFSPRDSTLAFTRSSALGVEDVYLERVA